MPKENIGISVERERGFDPLYHHSRPIEACIPGIVTQKVIKNDDLDEVFDEAYRWLEARISFYPLFMAVGHTEEDMRMTGYQNQWSKRGKGQNQVIFSYNEIPGGVFMDYMNWHIVLNTDTKGRDISDREKSWIFKPSWRKSDWLRLARKDPHSVQLVVPSLDLTNADSIWCRNEKTRSYLEKQGFQNVSVRRLAQQ